MKSSLLLISFIGLCCILSACSKSNGEGQSGALSSFTFKANDSLVIFLINHASKEDVYNTHTTMITGQNPDSVSQRGSIAIRVLGDTTGRFAGDSLQVTYVNAAGSVYYNTKDSGNYVVIDRFDKRYNGLVSGHFAMKVSDGARTVKFSDGVFSAFYQE